MASPWLWRPSCHTYPNDKLLQHRTDRCTPWLGGCHTYPNDKLLQHQKNSAKARCEVVIPIQTISFYNTITNTVKEYVPSCHTYPNDKLLQLDGETLRDTNGHVVIPIQTISFYNEDNHGYDINLFGVVIPIQTISFYNKIPTSLVGVTLSCHTYPNDKLLQQRIREILPFIMFVVIPIQTISFYNMGANPSPSESSQSCHTYPNDKLLQPTKWDWTSGQYQLSYLSKR